MNRKKMLWLLIVVLVACPVVSAALMLREGQTIQPTPLLTPLPSPTIIFAITYPAPSSVPLTPVTPALTPPVMATRAAVETQFAATASKP